MSQVSVDVRVFRYTRKTDGSFDPTEVKGYQTIVDDSHSYELPMVVTKKDGKGNTLEYIACNVKPSAPVAVNRAKRSAAVNEKTAKVETEARPMRKSRSIVAKPTKAVDHGPSSDRINEVSPTKETTAFDLLLAAMSE